MRSFLKSIPELLIILVVSHFLLGCGISYRPNYNQDLLLSYKTAQMWQLTDKKNYMVVHCGDQVREMYNPQFNEKTRVISSELKTFEGLALEYYKVRASDKSLRESYDTRGIPGASKEIYAQHHFFLDSSINISGNSVEFNFEDIEHVEILQHSNKGLIASLVLGSVMISLIIISIVAL